ncbi:MAG: polysaccharide biosynthesis protein [Betaproteobacteria bacterium]|nr:polysaccharide biosynthesis protein [Betaproteobacteria bacterium]
MIAPRSLPVRSLLAFLHDVLASALAWLAAFWLRFNLEVPPEHLKIAFLTLPWVVALNALLFWRFGLYRGLWRYASLPDLRKILAAVSVAALAAPALFLLAAPALTVPRSVFLMAPMLLIGAMSGSRLLYRAWKEGKLLGIVRHPQANPVIVLGAGVSAAALLHDLTNSSLWRVVALLDDDARKLGGTIHDVKVLGSFTQVGEIARRLGVTQAIVAIPGATHAARKRALDLCQAADLRVMTVPAYADIVSGKVSVSQLRAVELDDLLGRDPVRLDEAQLSGFLKGKTVLVTGAGGSIGSELCRQIARFAPAGLVLVENSEYALYLIEQEFRDRYPVLPVFAVIGDAKDEARMREIFTRYAPQVVFHAAAYKHVPLMEQDNALQALTNNALSTIVTARAAQAAGTQTYVLVSTDKAVNPTNVMGASKRIAEMLCQALQPQAATSFVMVRFGNVLGSTGSVIPRFREQIARGGPVTVTHPEMQRYFMSIPEAAQLVLQAAQLGKGGELFVLDMGEPVKIAELARQMIRLSGFTEQDIRIVFTGLRPGEKLFEEILQDDESTLPTPHPKLRIAQTRALDNHGLPEEVLAWLSAATANSAAPEAVRAQLKTWIAEYMPSSQ